MTNVEGISKAASDDGDADDDDDDDAPLHNDTVVN